MKSLRQRAFALTLFVSLVSLFVASAKEEERSQIPTWQDEIAKGCVPYHQLAVDDFRIDDQAHPDGAYWVRAFIHPYWHYITIRNSGWWYAYVDQWIVRSGFDKGASSRKSKFHEMKRALPHVQAYLDIYELYGRQLATLKPGELPSGRGATPQEAIDVLNKSLDAFLKEKYTGNDSMRFRRRQSRPLICRQLPVLLQLQKRRPPDYFFAPRGSSAGFT